MHSSQKVTLTGQVDQVRAAQGTCRTTAAAQARFPSHRRAVTGLGWAWPAPLPPAPLKICGASSKTFAASSQTFDEAFKSFGVPPQGCGGSNKSFGGPFEVFGAAFEPFGVSPQVFGGAFEVCAEPFKGFDGPFEPFGGPDQGWSGRPNRVQNSRKAMGLPYLPWEPNQLSRNMAAIGS